MTEGLDDPVVAHTHDDEREDEGDDYLAGLDGDAELVLTAAVKGARFVVDGGVPHFRYGEDERHHPDDNTGQLAEKHGLGAVAVSGDGLGDSEVAVHADEAEE